MAMLIRRRSVQWHSAKLSVFQAQGHTLAYGALRASPLTLAPIAFFVFRFPGRARHVAFLCPIVSLLLTC